MRSLRWLIPGGLAIAMAAAWLIRSPRIVTSLYDLMGSEGERIPQFVREQSAKEVSVIVSSADRHAAESAADALRRRHGAAPTIPEGAVEFLRRERAGLVSPEAATLLATAEGRRKLARRSLRRFYANPIPPILGWNDDPFLLTEGFISSLGAGRTTLETNGVWHILVKMDATGAVANCPGDEAGCPQGVTLQFCGAPVHARRSEERCKREINYLTIFSFGVIALLSLVVFRSLRWLPLLACSLAVSALAGALAICLAFDEIHLMTLVFGTTVLGLVIDYSYHWLLSDPAKEASTRRSMMLSFLTTEISLLPLALSSIPVLRQSAVFLGVGLFAAIGYVLTAYPRPTAVRAAVTSAVRGLTALPSAVTSAVCLLIAVLATAGLLRVSVKTDVTSLYRPPEDLLAAERLRAQFGAFDFSALPSMAERTRLAKNVEELYREQGKTLEKEGIAAKLEPPPKPTYEFASPKTLVNRILSAWTTSALKWLAISLAVMLLVLVGFFRRRALRIFAPSLSALVAVAGLLSLGGVTLNLFHLLAGFLLAGMAVDYTIFLHSGEKTALRSVTCSLLTSMAGFGALAFVSLPIVASFGQVLGLGLPIAFIVARGSAGRGRPAHIAWGEDAPATESAGRGRPAHGEEEKSADVEKAASPIGLEVLWLVYRLLGLRALHLMASAVGTCVWLASPAVRRASPSVRKVVNFTLSLADKLAVMAGGRHLPKVVTDDSVDARAFIDDVQGGRGVFVLSSHVGTIEALVAMGECGRTFHAWMDFSRTSVFTRFYMRHVRRERVVIHPIAEFGMGAVFEAGSLLDEGDCVLMAGDRGDGAFRFAAAFDHPVYFVACISEGKCRYRAVVRRLPSDRKAMGARYREIVSALSAAYPEQFFTWTT